MKKTLLIILGSLSPLFLVVGGIGLGMLMTGYNNINTKLMYGILLMGCIGYSVVFSFSLSPKR